MTTPNIGALAKLAPFLHCLEVGMHGEGTSVVRASDGRLVADDSTFSAGIAAALNEWAELRATVAELRRWRYEHDCRYTLGAVADLDLVHCPIDNPCVRCQRRLEWGAAQKENAELRASLKLMEHKVITCGVAATHPDAALTLRADYMKWNSPQAEAVRALRADRDELRAERERTAWQPIDTAPKDGTEILALCRAPARDGDYYEAVRYLTDAPCWVTREGWMRHPTHWMPLPAGPGQGAT